MNQNNFIKIILMYLILFIIPLSAQNKSDNGKKQYVKLEVEGLACPFCAYGLEKKINKIDGVENFDVNIKEGYVTFNVPKEKKVDKDELKNIVADAGFSLKNAVISDKPLANNKKSKNKD